MEPDADNKPATGDNNSTVWMNVDKPATGENYSTVEMNVDKPATGEENSTVAMNVDKPATGENNSTVGMKTRKNQWKTLKFDEYIYEVLKRVHPDIVISGEAMDMMNNIINSMMLKISEESTKFINLRGGASTIVVQKDIVASVKKLFPKKMADLALSLGFNALCVIQ